MFGLGKQRAFDRQEALRAAEDWRAKNKPKKAIAELRRVLAADPNDATAHARLAPLLISTGEAGAAVESFRVAAEDHVAKGFADKALSLYLQLCELEPLELRWWEAASKLHVERGRVAEGVKVLVSGAAEQRGGQGAPRAVKLLRAALFLVPGDAEVVIALARALHRAGERKEARELLEHAANFAQGRALIRVRRTQLRLFFGLGTLWRWLRA